MNDLDEGPKSRRRGEALETAILDAAWEVLIDKGYSGFTYEAIAASAGTSRPVLYRRWPQRDDLLLAVITKLWRSRPISVPDTGNLRDDAIDLLRNANTARVRMISVLSVQLMEYFRDSGSSFKDLRKVIFGSDGPSAFEQIVSRAVARGELPDKPYPPRMINLPFDLFRHEVMMTMQPLAEDEIIEIVDKIWLPLLKAQSV